MNPNLDFSTLINALRSQLQSGQLSGDDAKMQLQNSINPFYQTANGIRSDQRDNLLTNNTQALFHGLGQVNQNSLQDGMQKGVFDDTGNFSRQTTAIHRSITGGGGTMTNINAQTGGLPQTPTQPTQTSGTQMGSLAGQGQAIQSQLGSQPLGNPGTLINK
jgi:hypothetical protein